MNIFKKIKDSLLDKVQSRVIKEVKSYLPTLLKKHHQSFLIRFLSAGLLSYSFHFIMKTIEFKYPFELPLFICFFYVFCVLGFASGLITSFMFLIDYFVGIYYLKKAQFMDTSNLSLYKKIIHLNSNILLPIQELTKEELIELLSISLNPNQIQFFQDKIMLDKKFTLENLIELETISFDVMEENKKKNTIQQVFNEFLSQYDLTEHTYLTVEALTEKETTLSSKL